MLHHCIITKMPSRVTLDSTGVQHERLHDSCTWARLSVTFGGVLACLCVSYHTMDVVLDAASAAWAHAAAIAPKVIRVSVTTSIAAAALFALFVFVCRRFVFAQRTRRGGNWVSIAFFHPYWYDTLVSCYTQ